MNEEILGRVARWLAEASAHPQISEPTAMFLATSDDKGPTGRIVLLKHVDHNGLAFFTNRNSTKGQNLAHNPRAEICFYWMPLKRQLRVSGDIVEVSSQEADDYFSTRSRDSQIGAWASDQSKPLASREALLEKVQQEEARFKGQPVTRPPYWIGYRLIPQRIEFWEEAPHRLHDRDVYTRQESSWRMTKMNP